MKIKIREWAGKPVCGKFCYGTMVHPTKEQPKSLYIRPGEEIDISEPDNGGFDEAYLDDLMESSDNLIELVYEKRAAPKRKRRVPKPVEEISEEDQSGE